MAADTQAITAQKEDGGERASERRAWRKWLKRVFLAALALTVAYHALILFRVFRLRGTNPSSTAFIEARAGTRDARGEPAKREQVWVDYDRVSPHLVRAVIAAEDPWFNYHSGIDLVSVKRAAQVNWREKRIVQGGSTISQQLARNLFLSASRNPVRKLHEALIALEMTQVLGRRRVLEIYLNVVEWGDGVYGAEAAAQHYFNTSAASLNLRQAAFLAAILPNPREGNTPDQSSEKVRRRTDALVEQVERFAHVIDGNSGQDSAR